MRHPLLLVEGWELEAVSPHFMLGSPLWFQVFVWSPEDLFDEASDVYGYYHQQRFGTAYIEHHGTVP